jgi:hypothetical protein
MFIRSRTFFNLSIATILLFASIGAIADQYSTTLAYFSGPSSRLEGASVTYIDQPAFTCNTSDFAFVGKDDVWDGVPDGYMWICVEIAQYSFLAGIQGFITNPSNSRSLEGSNLDYWSNYAGVNYYIPSPASGSWLADADHYYGYERQYCPVEYAWPFDPWNPQPVTDQCTVGSSEYGIYYTSSSDDAQVP